MGSTTCTTPNYVQLLIKDVYRNMSRSQCFYFITNIYLISFTATEIWSALKYFMACFSFLWSQKHTHTLTNEWTWGSFWIERNLNILSISCNSIEWYSIQWRNDKPYFRLWEFYSQPNGFCFILISSNLESWKCAYRPLFKWHVLFFFKKKGNHVKPRDIKFNREHYYFFSFQ